MAISMNLVDGVLDVTTTPTDTSENTTGSTSLGKEAFLKLLVTQLQYQDPLEPQSNEEYISQLAQFSELEQMQNLASSFSNYSSLSLVGKSVIVEPGISDDTSSGNQIAGTVDYVQLEDGDAYLSIDGSLYKAEDLVTVLDDTYLSNLLASTDE